MKKRKWWRWLPGARAGQTDQANLGCSKSPGAFDAVAARMRLISCCHNKCCQSNDHDIWSSWKVWNSFWWRRRSQASWVMVGLVLTGALLSKWKVTPPPMADHRRLPNRNRFAGTPSLQPGERAVIWPMTQSPPVSFLIQVIQSPLYSYLSIEGCWHIIYPLRTRALS